MLVGGLGRRELFTGGSCDILKEAWGDLGPCDDSRYRERMGDILRACSFSLFAPPDYGESVYPS